MLAQYVHCLSGVYLFPAALVFAFATLFLLIA